MKDKTLSDKIEELAGDALIYCECNMDMKNFKGELEAKQHYFWCHKQYTTDKDALIHSQQKYSPADEISEADKGRRPAGTHGHKEKFPFHGNHNPSIHEPKTSTTDNASCTNNQHTKQSEHSPSTNPAGYRSSVKEPSDKSVDALRGSDNQGCKNHECVFSFEEKYVGKKGLYEPKKGETGFSIKRDDWICRCGKTRREYLGCDKTDNTNKGEEE